jgi:Arf-GAP/coiled-coil/ANK repeat/PH domain-containing protein
MDFFKRWGNVEANRRWEADDQHKVSKPKPSALVDVKKAYILEKYVARKYCHRGSAPNESALLTAINSNSVTAVMDVLLAGCHVKLEYIMLTAACECGDANLAILEILAQHNVNVNAVDDRSKDTALHYAVSKGYDACAKTLLRKGADASMKNFKGATAMDVAVARGGIRDDELLIMLTN